MRPAPRDVLILTALLLSGAASCIFGAIGMLQDTAAMLRPTTGDAMIVPAVGGLAWWVRACLGAAHCRQAGSVALRKAAATHASALWAALLAGSGAVIWGAALRCGPSHSRSIGGARFARTAELRQLARGRDRAWFPLGYVPPSRVLRRFWRTSDRVVRSGIEPFPRIISGPPICLPEEDLARHVLVIGLTGAHKTTAVTFPAVLEAARRGVSVVALDLKYGEEDSLARLAPEWWRWGRDVLVFAPLDPVSLRWNPLAGCRTLGEAHRLATLLFDDVTPSDPDLMYWMGVERHVCAAFAYALATDGGAPTFERMRALCEAGPSAVQAYVHGHQGANVLVARLGAFLAMLPKDEAGILQGIASRLEAWGDEAVCRATGVGDPWEQIDLDRLRREPVLLVVGVPQPALPRLRWLCHLFLRDLAARLLRPRGPEERVRVLQILEELPAWGPLPGLADHLATFRSRQVSVITTVQSEVQGEYVYGREGWAAVAANLVTKIYFPSLADLDAERLSRAIGTTTGEDVTRSRGWGGGETRKGEHRRDIPIPLRRPEELQGIGMCADEILVRFVRIPPAQLWCPPFYARPEYAGRVPNLPPATSELAVYHHLWHRRTWDDPDRVGIHPRPESHTVDQAALPTGLRAPTSTAGSPQPGDVNSSAGTPTRMPFPDLLPRSSAMASYTKCNAHASHPGFQDDTPVLVSGAAPTAEDVRVLSQLVLRLLDYPASGSRPSVRGIGRGGRLVEVRVDPSVAVRLCGSPDTMHVIVRRWAALRWVRRVRPVFVLERRALEVLETDLVRRLAAACGTDSG